MSLLQRIDPDRLLTNLSISALRMDPQRGEAMNPLSVAITMAYSADMPHMTEAQRANIFRIVHFTLIALDIHEDVDLIEAPTNGRTM